MGSLVLIVNEDDVERRYIGSLLAADGFDIIQAPRAIDAMFAIAAAEPSLLVVASRRGLAFEARRLRIHELVRILRRVTAAPLIIIGDSRPLDEINSLTNGGDVFVSRGYNASELISRCRLLVRRHEAATRENPRGAPGGGDVPASFAQTAQRVLEVLLGAYPQAMV